MKTTTNCNQDATSFPRRCLNSCRAVLERMQTMKKNFLRQYTGAVAEHKRLLQLALNEAEALAWETGYPHLTFATLAEEKAQAALSWHRQQSAMLGLPPSGLIPVRVENRQPVLK